MQCKSLWIKASAKCINVNIYLYRFIRLSFDKITDVRNMQIFNKVYQTGVSGDLRCCTYLADTDMLRCLTSVKNSLKSHLFSFHIGAMSTLNGFV